MLTHTVPAKHGAIWIARGWSIFKQHPGKWIWWSILCVVAHFLLAALTVLLIMQFHRLPINLSLVFTVFWTAGVGAAAQRSQATGLAPRLTDIFRDLRAKLGPLLKLSVFALIVGAFSDTFLTHKSAALVASLSGHAPNVEHVSPLGIGLALVIYLAAMLALWLAPLFVMLNNAHWLDALKASFIGVCRNVWSMLIYGLIIIGLLIVSVLTLGLGMLVTFPLLFLSMYVACGDICPRESTPK